MLVGRILVQVFGGDGEGGGSHDEGRGGVILTCTITVAGILCVLRIQTLFMTASSSAGPVARLSRPFRVEIDLRGRLLVIDDARERGSLRLVDANLIPPKVLLQHLGFWI
jgi:hypothetical protein